MKENKSEEIIFTGELAEIYANFARVNVNPFEFEITLGVGSSIYEGIKPAVNVRMSPEFAKGFCENLMNSVKTYEENIGKINSGKK